MCFINPNNPEIRGVRETQLLPLDRKQGDGDWRLLVRILDFEIIDTMWASGDWRLLASSLDQRSLIADGTLEIGDYWREIF